MGQRVSKSRPAVLARAAFLSAVPRSQMAERKSNDWTEPGRLLHRDGDSLHEWILQWSLVKVTAKTETRTLARSSRFA
jgi:hypothetical protein